MAIVALYSVAQLTWYLDTPLGKSPVLDGQENLILAQQIGDGTLAKEPFYRAMLYPSILAYMPIGHSVLGLLCHLANAALAISLARRFWNEERAGLIAGGLVGFNPVLLHFAFDPLDTTVAITFFLSALSAIQNAIRNDLTNTKRTYLFALAGLAISLATLARPHFFLTVVVLFVPLLLATTKKRISAIQFGTYAVCCLIPLLAYGFVQKSWSGNFQILPWQGAYNLWISNNSDANGLYYQQTVSFHHLGSHQNPNRMEAEYLYQKAHGHSGSIKEQSDYWRSQTLQHIANQPLSWLKLEAFKLYAIFNNFEQYNNKTYSFHKELSPWLRYNPIGWGVLLAISTFCVSVLWRQKRHELLVIATIALSLVAGLLIYMASARFRLPLTPILAVLAGGLPLSISVLAKSSIRLRYTAIFATLFAILISFSRFAGIASERTYIQDALLIADASARIGDDAQAIKWSSYVLERKPQQQQALRLQLISRYNEIASGERESTDDEWNELLAINDSLQLQDQLLSFIHGVILWNLDQKGEAHSTWLAGIQTYGPRASTCIAALKLTRGSPPTNVLPSPIEPYISQGNHWLLAYALATDLDLQERQTFLTKLGLSPATFQSIGESLERILP